MAERDKHKKSYTASDIRQYLDGRLSALEMHALEKAALDDPFLADAIEGMSQRDRHATESFETDIEALGKRLERRISPAAEKRPLVLRWQAAAASILLIVSGAVSYYFLIKKPSADREISLNRRIAPVPDSAVQSKADNIAATPTQPANPRAADNPAPVAPAPLASAGSAATRNTRPARVQRIADSPKKISGAPELAAPNEPAQKEEEARADLATNQSLQGRVSGLEVQKSRRSGFSPAPEQLYIQGLVTDSSGRPLPGATVLLKDKKNAALTDQQGFFKLKTDDADSVQDVVVSAPGYKKASTSMRPSQKAETIIPLAQAGNDLNEVVVTGYGIKRNKRRQAVEPAGGWSEYNNYLSKNKRINTADSSLSGIEMVTFLVHRDGRLTDFKIEQSLSPAHDAEIIRLIQQGPRWMILKGKKQRGHIRLAF